MLNFKSSFDYSAHELANLLPMTSASEFANLKSDIAANGLLQPIWLFEGRILDGRNRYRACREIGYSFGPADFREFEGDYSAAEAFVFSTNFQRRQLSKAQMNEVICKTLGVKYGAHVCAQHLHRGCSRRRGAVLQSR